MVNLELKQKQMVRGSILPKIKLNKVNPCMNYYGLIVTPFFDYVGWPAKKGFTFMLGLGKIAYGMNIYYEWFLE